MQAFTQRVRMQNVANATNTPVAPGGSVQARDLARDGNSEMRALASGGSGQMRALADTIIPATRWHTGSTYSLGIFGNSGDLRIQLHSILVLGLHLGIRFDEISKVRVEHIYITSGMVNMTLTEAIKNSTVQRDYVLEEWPGNSELRFSLSWIPS